MKIIQVGRADPQWSRKFDCVLCGSVVEVERKDLVLQFEHDISGARQSVLAACCVCNNQIVVDDPAHEDWGVLPFKISCSVSHRTYFVVPYHQINAPVCPNCKNVINIRPRIIVEGSPKVD